MIDLEKEKNKHLDTYKKALFLLTRCVGLEKHVRFVSDDAIFCETTMSWQVSLNVLSEFTKAHGKYELTSYYMNSNTEIAAKYQFKDFQLVLFCNDVNKAIESLGKGKCRIEEQSKTEKTIVCDL